MQYLCQLEPSGQRFLVDAGETVLHAARLQNMPLRFSCLHGNCGACKAYLLAGEVAYPYAAPVALSETERAEGAVLLCQATACTDLRIAAREVPAVKGLYIRQFSAELVGLQRLGGQSLRVRLALPKGEQLHFLAGQYLDVLGEDGKRRSFSIASPPERVGELELHLRIAPGNFADQVRQKPLGSWLRLEAPLGTFVPREDGSAGTLWLAGGTGFAPIAAMLGSRAAQGRGLPPRAVLAFGAASPEDLYAEADIQQLQTALPALEYVSAVDSAPRPQDHHGNALDAVFKRYPNLSGWHVYMAGPPAMIRAAKPALIAAGVAEDEIYYDSFDQAPDPRMLLSR
jgi:CDP-4-dehydro-6-deoxyglucose reductase, E3